MFRLNELLRLCAVDKTYQQKTTELQSTLRSSVSYQKMLGHDKLPLVRKFCFKSRAERNFRLSESELESEIEMKIRICLETYVLHK